MGNGMRIDIAQRLEDQAEVDALQDLVEDIAPTEIAFIDGVTAGTVTASKAVVVGANKNIDTITIADSGLKLGSGAGTAVTATAAELNLLDTSVAGTAVASRAAVLGANKELDEFHTAALYLGADAGTLVTATASDINVLHTATAGSVLVGTKTDLDVTLLDNSAEGAIVVGQGAGETCAAVTLSGDVTMAKTGAVTIASGSVENAMLATDVAKIITGSGGDTMSREENIAGLSSAITLANEVRGDIINHFANATRHTTGQQDTSGIAAEATNLATLLTLTTSVMALYVLHNADAVLGSGWAYHNEQAAAKALANEDAPTTLVEAVTKLNDLKGKYNDHEDETTGHASQASVTADQVAAADAAYGVANRVPVTGAATGDIVSWSILDSGTGTVTGVSATAGTNYVDFTFSADPQNDAIISYIVMRPAV